MTSVSQDRQASRAKAEQAAIDRIVVRLEAQFPDLPGERIMQIVIGEYDGYAQSPIRDFVPILVERSARRHLVTGAAPRDRA